MNQTERRLLILEARQKLACEILNGRHDPLPEGTDTGEVLHVGDEPTGTAVTQHAELERCVRAVMETLRRGVLLPTAGGGDTEAHIRIALGKVLPIDVTACSQCGRLRQVPYATFVCRSCLSTEPA